MSKSHDSIRVVRMNEPNYTSDARLVQVRAASRQASVIRLGAIVFFSTATLLGFARRHALIEPDLAERTGRQLLQLKHKLAFPG